MEKKTNVPSNHLSLRFASVFFPPLFHFLTSSPFARTRASARTHALLPSTQRLRMQQQQQRQQQQNENNIIDSSSSIIILDAAEEASSLLGTGLSRRELEAVSALLESGLKPEVRAFSLSAKQKARE